MGQNWRYSKGIWNRLSIPKHRFILWLALKQRLMTRERLAKMGITECTDCCLCGVDTETHEHLFFECGFSRRCLIQLHLWLGVRRHDFSLYQHMTWLLRSHETGSFHRKVIMTSVAALVYQVWRARNDALWNNKVPSIQSAVQQIKFNVKHRINQVYKNMTPMEHRWFDLL
ncbi:uncharacterized protein LOC104897645 [Beta vulgaris subsp. vulgaris]|uniref:uncharacterized protein LOC104897645 n=1 Tax=Beta vulgaris subsp. vulgaris TaxID=3555 RepID=UPI00053F716F|nr:uncharacterized protein LOC104897645 [Beta vulgaris subsp. vulgaris]